MFSKKEIKKLANEAYDEFSKKHKISCNIFLIDLNEFWNLAKKSKLIQFEMKRKIPLKVGALVMHGKKDTIYLNQDILNQITNDKNFVKAIVIHELCHIYLKNKMAEDSLKNEISSENRADFYLHKHFPQYAAFFI